MGSRDWCKKKLDWLKIWLLVKNPQFLTNQADIQATSPTHELVILTKSHKDWEEIVDFLVIVKSWASLIFFASVSSVFSKGAYIFFHDCTYKSKWLGSLMSCYDMILETVIWFESSSTLSNFDGLFPPDLMWCDTIL